jgi:peptidyl-tRNA hydrolase, PTH1 family
VVGLGNPGPEFAETRHNLGFRCVDLLARRCSAAWHDKRAAFAAQVAVAHPTNELNVVLAKPQTFMNRSGTSVRDLLEAVKLQPRHALVVFDEMDLPFGTLRLRERGSAGTHNGMRSVVATLQTEEIPRLRIGIGQGQPGAATDHVLGEFSPEERKEVESLVERAADAVLDWAELGANAAMNRYNKT